MKVIKVLFQIILIIAVLGASVYTVLFGLGGDPTAADINIDDSYFAYPEGMVDSAIGTKLASVVSGHAYLGDPDTFDPDTGYAAPIQSGTLTPNSIEMAYAIYRVACLADFQVAAKSWTATGWGSAKLTGNNAYGAMSTFSSGAYVLYTTDAERQQVEIFYNGGSYSVSDTYTIVTDCSAESLKSTLGAVLNAGRKKQVGIDGSVLEWKCSKDPQITDEGGTAVYMPSEIKQYTAQKYYDEFGDADRAYTYPGLLGEWYDGYGLDSPDKGGHVMNLNTMQPRIITQAQYDALTENGLSEKENKYNPIDTDLKQYLTQCNAEGEDDVNGEYYRWDYIITLVDEASGKTYYRLNFALDCANPETTEYSAAGLAKSVGGAATIAYSAYSTTFEVWENGLFKMFSSNEQWTLEGAGALAALNLNAVSDANSLEYYSYDEDFVYNYLKNNYIQEEGVTVLFPETVTDNFPQD